MPPGRIIAAPAFNSFEVLYEERSAPNVMLTACFREWPARYQGSARA